MKRKFLFGTGAVVLALASVIAGRASVKFATPTALYGTISGGTCTAVATGTSVGLNSLRFNTVASGNQAFIVTSGIAAKHVNLWATSTCQTKKVYYN
jgi:hypothetical protein